MKTVFQTRNYSSCKARVRERKKHISKALGRRPAKQILPGAEALPSAEYRPEYFFPRSLDHYNLSLPSRHVT